MTSFPRRYGVGKSDPSGVHKAIRMRLGSAREGQIKSAFDTALVVIEELDIMLCIAKRQRNVLEEFIRTTKTILREIPDNESNESRRAQKRRQKAAARAAVSAAARALGDTNQQE